MEKNPQSQLEFARFLLTLCEEKLRHAPQSAAAKDAAERIDGAFMALVKGFDWGTFEWGAVVGQLEELSKGDDLGGAAAAMEEADPRLNPHRALLLKALEAFRADAGKWEAALALLDAAGLYRNPPRRTAEKPSELLRQRWAQVRRKGVPLAFRPVGWVG